MDASRVCGKGKGRVMAILVQLLFVNQEPCVSKFTILSWRETWWGIAVLNCQLMQISTVDPDD